MFNNYLLNDLNNPVKHRRGPVFETRPLYICLCPFYGAKALLVEKRVQR